MQNINEHFISSAMKVIILCEGFGTRLSSIISDRPKPLAPIAGKPFIEHIIKWLCKYGYRDIIFCVSYKAEQIVKFIGDGKKFGIKATYSQRAQPSGTGGAIKFAGRLLQDKNESVLVLNGDTLFDINLNKFVEFHDKNKSFATIALSHVLDVHQYGEVSIDSGYQLIKFSEKNPESLLNPHAGLVNGGVYLLSQEALNILSNLQPPFSIEKDFFSIQVNTQKIFGYVSDTTHHDMGTPSGYRKTDKILSGQEEILIRSRAPLRISFGGGGTDVSPFDQKYGGCVLNCTINKYVYGLLKLRDDKKIRLVSSDYRLSVIYSDIKHLEFDGHLDLIKGIIKRVDVNYGFELEVRSDVPPNSGMGSSAGVCVAVIGLFNHLLVESKMTKSQIAELAYKVEVEDLKNHGGRQDQYASVYGGFNFFEFRGDDFVKVSPLNLKREILLELERNTVLVYTGKRGISGLQHDNNEISLRKRSEYLQAIKVLGYESFDSLTRGDMNRFGNILEETWELKKKAFPKSTNKYIDSLYLAAKTAGAIGGRVAGAGGGGHMVFYCRPGSEHKVTKVLQAMGTKSVDFSFDYQGLETWEV